MENKTENQLVKFRREHIGFIFQSFNLMGTMNAVENVALPLTFQGVDDVYKRQMLVRNFQIWYYNLRLSCGQ